MTKAKQIKAAIAKLDAKDDAHWTKRGEPNVAVISEYVGAKCTRVEVTAAVGTFNRTKAEAVDDRPRETARRRTIVDAVAVTKAANAVMAATENPRGMTGPQKEMRLAAQAVLKEAGHG